MTPKLQIILSFLITSIWAGSAGAQLSPNDQPHTRHINTETRRTIIEPVPSTQNIFRVSAAKTPSGFAVPRYVSLKYGQVNGRTGPSMKHPIAWQYQRRQLPLIIVAETEMWRRVRDIAGDESWVRKPALSGVRTVMTLHNTPLYTHPTDSSRVIANVSKNAILSLKGCNAKAWCEIKSDTGIKGWMPRHHLWGATPLY